MKIQEIRLFKEPGKSFILYHERNPFSHWHHHPEYEITLITKGRGKRVIGDHIDSFEENDLAVLGPHLPHEWKCEDSYFLPSGEFMGEGIVIQFLPHFLGDGFFDLPENNHLNKLLAAASVGCLIHGNNKSSIIDIMLQMPSMDQTGQFYSLFSIFYILSSTTEFEQLSSPGFLTPFLSNDHEPLRRVVEYIMQNFQKEIKINDLLDISNMSATTFFTSFKKAYRMTFKQYLLGIRIGYSCRLLTDQSLSVSQIAFESGFENLSNFNRHFKKLKGCTPRDYKHDREEIDQSA